MSSSDQEVSTTIPGISLATSVQITIAMLILNFILCVAIFMLYLRAKYCSVTPSRSRRLIFAPHEPSLPRRALDASVLNSIPIKIFRAEDFKEDGGLECAVCLSELTDGEQARLLPKCNHGFHVECIDMWFNSNSTCPLCRNPVGVDNSINPFVEIPILEAVSNLNEECSRNAETSSSASAAAASLVIDIPRRMMNGFSAENSSLPWSAMSPNSPLMTSRLAEKAVKSPGLGRMRSLRRMLSRGKGMGVVSSSSPRFRECDVEQEGASDLKSQ